MTCPACLRPSSEVLAEARALDLLGPMDLDQQVDARPGLRACVRTGAHADAGRWRWRCRRGRGRSRAAGWTWDRGRAPRPGPGPATGRDAGAVLLDAADRRTSFLADAVETLGWDGPRPGRPGPGRGCWFDPWSPREVRRGLGQVVREPTRHRRMCRPLPASPVASWWCPSLLPRGQTDRPVASTVATRGLAELGQEPILHGASPVRVPGRPAGDAVPGSLSPAVRRSRQAAPVPGPRGVIEKAPLRTGPRSSLVRAPKTRMFHV